MPRFYSEALLPVFESVVNSIQAIHEMPDYELSGNKGQIIVTVHRQDTLLKDDNDNKIIGFEIEDNGVGFNDTNFQSFLTSDTTYKSTKGCKGVGRFLWLRAFDLIEIESVFNKNKKILQRKIRFSLSGIESSEPVPIKEQQKTVVKLKGFKDEYRNKPSAFKTTEKIAQRILEHCLSYFINGTAPQIIVKDENDSVDLQSKFQDIKDNIITESFVLDVQPFTLSHIRLYSTHLKMHNIVLCAGGRDVRPENISSTLGVSAEFDDDDKKFIYAAYLFSPYLDKHVDMARMSFEIPKEMPLLDGIKKDRVNDDNHTFISMEKIKEEVIKRSKKYLATYLEGIQKRKEEKVSEYIDKKNPTLRFVPHYNPSVYDEIQPNMTEEKIDEVLYKHKGKAEYELKRRGNKILKTQAQSYDEIKEDVDKITTELEGFQKDQLASYIVLRKLIIDLLDKKLELNKDGKYPNEIILHDIILPRKSTSDELPFENHNLWLIDERLTFHHFAASDKPISDFSDTKIGDRPDIVIFSEIAPDRTARSVSIIEFKKPQRTDNFGSITQLYDYVRDIKQQKIKSNKGRPIQTTDYTTFYCYAVCDITEPMKKQLADIQFTKLKDGLEYYSYNLQLYCVRVMFGTF
jgi:hypothetical protein